ncbi:fumarylacetoacetate hydrolase family protein [Parafrankia sp. BMG5.11]|uniref:fumarylacetoacetate hydrolase family protein n=1 Tax=Parafrankia sp. BMG5.11 TaxID=222540 RepID=UPI00103C3C2E|nr:fumarylacetoacetate hydrolase family protein [Parafrankia sp. BMG5.11]TCJ33507.1 FAA hydrolase family protein [Parafrankia sp. BMG5.11]
MRLARMRTSEGPRVVVSLDGVTFLSPFETFGTAFAAGILENPGEHAVAEISAPVEVSLLPAADPVSKVICVGHNYRDHILELGHPLPEYPNVFSKFPEALVGPADPIVLSPEAKAWDWEAELALVIGRRARRVSPREAGAFIAGYTVANDVSARDWQRRGTQWLLGKTFERTTPIGPWIVAGTVVDPRDGLTVTCSVDGVEKQRASTKDLVFPPDVLVSYLSHVLALRPGDIVLTGTPGGVGVARQPAEFLAPGSVVVTTVSELGTLRNVCVEADVH